MVASDRVSTVSANDQIKVDLVYFFTVLDSSVFKACHLLLQVQIDQLVVIKDADVGEARQSVQQGLVQLCPVDHMQSLLLHVVCHSAGGQRSPALSVHHSSRHGDCVIHNICNQLRLSAVLECLDSSLGQGQVD